MIVVVNCLDSFFVPAAVVDAVVVTAVIVGVIPSEAAGVVCFGDLWCISIGERFNLDVVGVGVGVGVGVDETSTAAVASAVDVFSCVAFK